MENFKILHQKENPLFNRKEVEVSIEANVAPKMQEAEEFIAKHFTSHHENIKIIKIKGNFGSKRFIITAKIYHTKEDKDKTEPKSKKGKQAAEIKTTETKEAKSEEKKE